MHSEKSCVLLKLRCDEMSYKEAIAKIMDRANRRLCGFVCFANVHMVMESYDDPGFADILNRAFIIAPDGQPVRWAMRLFGIKLASRCDGPNTADLICAKAEVEGLPIGLYGAKAEDLLALNSALGERYPRLKIAYSYSPPFRELSQEESIEIVNNLNNSGARILLVGLGCPKQEKWMAAHSDFLSMPLLGVGAWFDFAAGVTRRAPVWMQKCGLEWAYRLSQEPGRLWRRYCWHNPRYLLLIFYSFLKNRSRGGGI